MENKQRIHAPGEIIGQADPGFSHFTADKEMEREPQYTQEEIETIVDRILDAADMAAFLIMDQMVERIREENKK